MGRLLLLALMAAVSGCTVGPNYHEPSPPLPPAFAEPQAAEGNIDLARWWKAFGDPELTHLIETGLAQAPDLKTAESRVRQARYGIVEARSQGLPEIDGSGKAQYLKFHRLGNDSDIPELIDRVTGGQQGAAGTTSSVPMSFHSFSAGFDASWEIDLFGGVRRQTEAATAQTEAAIWDARDARVRLVAEIASDYLQMRGDQQQADIARSEADRQQRALDILAHTSQVGLVPEGNVLRQRTQLAAAQAKVEPLSAEANVQIHALAVLLGMTPEALLPELSAHRALPDVPPAIPPGLPMDLLRRRPDVRAAEHQLAAATADIGVAVADLYPKISLTAAPQLATAWLGSFFLGKSLQLSAAGQASFPIFDFGRRRAVVGERREQREQAYWHWRQTVLGALRDVEDALARVEADKDGNERLRAGLADAVRALAAVDAQYRAGLENYTPVLDAQQEVLQARQSLSDSDVRLRQDMASLYKALGGGWTNA
jgi:NodT family efflux transporter outer membrane factor (OMF) lipoprotein